MNSPDARDNKDNPVALISGGAAGIGRTIACAFLADGYGVHICDSSRENVEAFVAENPAATASIADVADAAQVETVFADLADRYGRLDVLVNNAGIAGPTARVQDISIDDWDECIGVDLSGLFYMTRLAVPLLRQRDGSSIINIASTAALHGYPLRSAYAASKWAQVGLTKTWAMELGPDGIRVNTISPGSVEGPRIDAVIQREAVQRDLTPEQVRDVYLRQTSMRTFITADDVASMAVFLASEGAARVSGQIIAVDGYTEGLTNWLDK
jgi:NAD(P)-dependent dehydrogenase (short-subunit alcohol dehydrogenase family)